MIIILPAEQRALKSQVDKFRSRFQNIAKATILCLIACEITVASMPFFLTEITTLNDHKLFLDEELEEFGKCETHRILFGKLNFYWNYLAYDLLYQFIKVIYGDKQFKRAFKRVCKDMRKI